MLEKRPYQERIVDKTVKAYNDGLMSVLIESPTGSGKTVCALTVAKEMERQGFKIGWVALRRNLLAQAERENQEKGFSIKNIKYISLFSNDLPKDVDFLVLDECLPYESQIDALLNGIPTKVAIGDIATKRVGSHVLSRGHNGTLAYKSIISRTDMGRKELYEVVVDTPEGQKILLLTENGRVFANGQYLRAKSLQPGMSVLYLSSCCQTYLYERESIQGASRAQSRKGSAVRLRMRTEGAVERLVQEVQQVPVLASPEGREARQAFTQAAADHHGNCSGRWLDSVHQEPEDARLNGDCTAAHKALHEEAACVHSMAQARTGSDLRNGRQDRTQRRIRKGSGLLQHALAPNNLSYRRGNLRSEEVCLTGIPAATECARPCRLVDGRRFDDVHRDARFYDAGEQNDRSMVLVEMEDQMLRGHGQESESAIHPNQDARYPQAFEGGVPPRAQEPLVQVREIPAPTSTGTIVSVRRTGRFVETYDIGVADNQNFFADDILVHNCHHQACGTCVTLLNTIKPKKFLGMTATPWRTDRMQLSFQKIVKDAGIHILIEEGFLSPYVHFVMPEYTPASVAKLYAEEKDRWGKTVMYFLKKEECYECQILLRDVYGIPSEVVTGESDRETQLDRFERGEISVVLNVFVLSEGFDCPDLRSVFVRPSCKAPTIQMGGRVFRKHPTKPFAQIVQSQDADFAFPDHARPMEQFTLQDGKWYSVKGNNNVPIAQGKVLQVIASSADVKMPGFISKNSGIAHRRRRGRSRANRIQTGGTALPPGLFGIVQGLG